MLCCAAEAQNVQGTDVLGKGFIAPIMHSMSAGKGAVPADVNVDVQCTDVCRDVCTPVPQKVCNEVPYQTQVNGALRDYVLLQGPMAARALLSLCSWLSHNT